MQFRTERTHQNSHNDWSAGYAETYRSVHSRDVYGNCAQRQTENQSEENAAYIRFVESLDLVSEKLLHIVHSFVFAHNCYAVAVLQTQVVGGKELYVSARNATDVNAVCISQLQLS